MPVRDGGDRAVRGRRRPFGVVIAIIAAAAFVPAHAAVPDAGPDARTILPPGEGGTVTLQRYVRNQASGNCADLGPNVCDQVDMYKNWQFKDGTLARDADHVAGKVTEERPVSDLRLVRDTWGVPHVFAGGANEQEIEDNLGFGVGYAQAEERLFQMEILRRAAEGRLSDLLGPTNGTTDLLLMDTIVRRDSETDAERLAQLRGHLTRGQQHSLQRYADGINAVIRRFTLDPSQMPAGFILTQDLPIRPWTASDSLAIQILETKTVAESAGNELGYGALARRLRDTYGVSTAVGILNDVQLTHDSDTPTSVPHGHALHSSDANRYDFINFTPADTALRITEIPPSVESAMNAVQKGDDAVRSARRSLGLPQFGSNAWAVAPSRSTTGHAMLWGAPQVSYYVPQVVDEIEIFGGPNHARGMSVPGAGPAVVIGYTPHHAWSLTSSQDDQADTYIDRVRRRADGSFEYLWNGGWRPVQQRTETITTRVPAPPQDPAPPPPIHTSKEVTFYRTLHGRPGARVPCVVEHIDVDAGLSYCKVRSFWGAEIETGLAVVDMARAASVADADRAARRSVSGFNFVYADRDGHIAYWHTGRLPIRVRGHDPRLPAPGDGSFDWRGYLDPRLWPTVTDPAQGFVVSWNNKPQAGWPDSGDGVLWGATQRVGEPRSLIQASSRLSPDDTWHVARRSGELDLRETLGFARFITTLAGRGDLSPLARASVAQVAHWDGTAFYPGGAERDESGKETGKVRYAGFAVLTEWMHALLKRAGQPVFQPVTHNPDTAAGVRAFTRTPGTTSPEFEFFDDYEAFLFDMLDGRTKSGVKWFGEATAQDVSKAALDDAVSSLRAAQGNDPSKWRADMPHIDFMATDVVSTASIPWENRGTWGQIVAFGVRP